MSSTINTNISSLTANRSLTKSQGALATSIQRLSSGLRVNSAKDDAAGLAIGERMSSQIRGLNTAARNSSDGISLAQVAEGGMSAMTNILQRCRELSVQAANGTNSASDRKAISQEVDRLLTELDSIGNTAEFNGQKLLDGSFNSSSFQVGANAGQTIEVSIPKIKKDELGYYQLSTFIPPFGNPIISGDSSSTTLYASPQPARSMEINGKVININQDESAGSVANKINAVTNETGVTATSATNAAFNVFPKPTQVSMRLVSGSDYSKAASVSFSYDGSDEQAHAAMAAINAKSNITGVTAENFLSSNRTGSFALFRLVANGGDTLHILNDSNPSITIELLNSDWTDVGINVQTDFRTATGTGGSGTFGTDDLTVIGGITLFSDNPVNFVPDGSFDAFGDPSGFFSPDRSFNKISLNSVSSQSGSAASKSLKIFDVAISQVSSARANLGAIQSRFEYVISNLNTSSENSSASRSRIMDADFAAETAELSRTQILQQAGTVMLAQANQQPQLVLQLLK